MDLHEQEHTTAVHTQPHQNPFIIPIAIILGLGLIAVVLFITRSPQALTDIPSTDDLTQDALTQDGSIRPVSGEDHILGNPNAPIVIVEYADFDCPFCKKFQGTMNKIMDDYGSSGRVAWVYRHFPIEQLHPNAKQIALASECIADLGSNAAFWQFADLIYEGRSGSAPTNITNLNRYATDVGVDVIEFNTCINEERFMSNVKDDTNEALALGVKGTPYSLILIGDQQGPIEGALSYEGVRQVIETLLSQIEGNPTPAPEGI